MQSLRSASTLSADSYVCAQELLDVVPLVMRIIRKHMRSHRSGLTVPQFRTLCYVSSTPESSLSDVADFIGLSLPAMSRLVDGMVDKGLMGRRTCANDRRHIRLSVTPEGEAALAGARRLAQERLADVLAQLPAGEQQELTDTLRMVREIFSTESPTVHGEGPADD